MFKTIFYHELRFWLRNPITYIFAFFLFGTTFLSMWGMAAEEASGPTTVIQNSSVRLNYLTNFISQILIFMIPAISGLSIFRDFQSRMYTVLYTYPFTKIDYLGAKYAASFLIVLLIGSCVGLGFIAGSYMPGVNPDALKSFSFADYAHLYGLFVIPNLLLLSIIIFSTVAMTRNVYIGFIAAIFIFIFNGLLSSLPGNIGAYIDPLGKTTVENIIQFWTLEERNTRSIPLHKMLILNRLLWFAFSIGLGITFFSRFKLSQHPISIFRKKVATSSEKVLKKIKSISLPEVTYKFNWTSRLKAIWNTSNSDLRSIILSWPFLAILLSGFCMVYFQQIRMAPQYGVPILPTTAEMLRIPMFIFSGIFNLLTFLYSGVVIFKGENTRMKSLVDIAPQANNFFLFSRLLTVLKMQFFLLTLIFISGILVQTIKGYYNYEFWHYSFELYLINYLHFAIWACMAILIHTLLPNLYLSFFLLLLIPIGILMLPAAADTLNMPWLNESFLHFNHVPDLYVGFEYSAFNHYGSALAVYFFYKIYWLVGAILMLLLSLLIWKRGYTFSFKERLRQASFRLRGGLKAAIVGFLLLFLGMGANVFYQEHYVSKTFYTQEEEDFVYAQNEIRYSKFIDHPQPRIVKANLDMDIFPKTRDYKVNGSLFFVNVFDQAIDTILVGTSFKDKVSIELKNPNQILNLDEELRYITFKLDKSLQKGDTLEILIDIQNHPNSILHDNSRALSNGTFITGQIIPTLGVRQAFLSNKSKRKKYGLPDREVRDILPSDTTLLGYEFIDNNMGRIEYESRITTSLDQTAFTMGDLLESGVENGRNYFHYKSSGPIKNTISWISGRYEKSESDILDIYHHPDHGMNNEYLREGAELTIKYCEKWFSPLQHDKLKLIEFPLSLGSYATLNGNLIPFSEIKMLCDIDHEKNEEFNHPFFVASHELAHYWWGHKVDPANVKGGKLISESMAEYISKKVVEAAFGKEVIRKDREKEQNTYFKLRAEQNDEVALNIASNEQQYLNYVKGGLALTTLSEYIGEEKLNHAFASFEDAYRYKEPPFPTSLNFIDTIRHYVPDSLTYLIEDLFETITLYDNKINNVESTDGKCTIDVNIRKYRTNEIGKVISEESLSDYIRVATYRENSDEENIHLIKFEKKQESITLELGYNPVKVVIDPDILLLDVNREDNIWKK